MILPSKEFLDIFKATEGALSVTESIAIMNIAAQAPEGLFAEFGTYKGKATISAIYGKKPKSFYLNDILFENSVLITEVSNTIKSICNEGIDLRFYQCHSVDLIPQYKYAFAFWDTGDHGEELVQSEKILFENAMIEGGLLVLHDFENQFTAVRRAYDQLISTNKFEPINIDWQPILDYVIKNNLEEGNNSWHLYPELGHPPNFVGALKRK